MHVFALRKFCGTCALLLLLLLARNGQAQNARFYGQITDPEGAAVANAAMEATNQDTGAQIKTTTDESGNYSVPYLTAGNYRMVVQAPGFNVSVHDVALGMGQALIFNVQLTVGGSQTTVNVQAGEELTELHLESNEVSGTITGKEVAALQLNGRNFTQLIALAPGVSNQTQQDEAKVGMAGSVAYSVNGGRTEYNSFQVDGSETLNVGINKNHSTLIIYPSLDAIQEIKVLTSNYGAQYPSTGNGTTIVTTKSGTDSFHGSIYEYFRNEDLNAKGYFDIGKKAPLYRRNDFGGSLGGAILIPHVYDGKGKSHFFYSEEGRLETSPTAYRQAVPSLAERNGDFSDVCPTLANGTNAVFSRTQYPDCPDSTLGNGTPYTFTSNQMTYPNYGTTGTPFSLNQNAVAILNSGAIPLPNATTGCNSTGSACYLADASLPTYWREELIRIDRLINAKWQAGFHYIHDEWDETAPVPQYATTQNSFPTIENRFYAPGTSIVGRATTVITPTFLNEFVASYSNSHINLRDIPGLDVNLARPSTLGGACLGDGQCPMRTIFNNGSTGTDGVAKLPGIMIAGSNAEYGGFGFAADPGYMPWEHSNPTYAFTDNITKSWGPHNLQFGAQWLIFQRNQTNGPIGAASGDTQGLLTFSNLRVNGSTGNAFADFLYEELDPASPPGGTGAISSFQQDSGQSRYRQRYQIVEPYFQDDFKVNSRLTLNLGLRLSLFGTFYELNNSAYNWEHTAFSASAAQDVTIDTGGGLRQSGSLVPIPIYRQSGAVNPILTNGIVQCGVSGRPSSCMSGHLFNPAPRIGFAWDPTASGKTAIRSGYGVFFEHGTADEANTGSLEGGAPGVLSMTQVNPPGWSTIGETASNQGTQSLTPIAFALNVTSIPTKVVWPYVQQWSLNVEQQLPGNTLASFAYVGSKGTHLTAALESNQLAPISGANNPFGPHQPLVTRGPNPAAGGGGQSGDCTVNAGNITLTNGIAVQPGDASYINLVTACYASAQSNTTNLPAPNSLRSYAPGLGEIFSLQNVASSGYNAFQTTLRKVQGPLTLGVAYTYSHSIDDA